MKPTTDLKVMTQEEHDELVAIGCDPHCHACDAKISVGDRWDFKVFMREGELITKDGLVIGNVRGTCCATCIENDRGLSNEELNALEKRLRAVSIRRAVSKTPPPAQTPMPPVARHGCFVLDDGTRF
jgi:hypothetical protein